MTWTIKRAFESFDDFLDHVESNDPVWSPANRNTETAPRDWNGNVTFAQAVNLARYGWPEGRDHMANVSCDMKPENVEVSEAITRQIDVAGAYPIVPLAVAGDPSHMVDIIEADTPHRIIRAVCSVSHNWTIKAVSLMRNGGAVASYIDALELAGWSCEIWSYFRAEERRNVMEYHVCLKAAGEMLDIDRVAFGIAHPAMLRRLIFRAMEIEAKAERDFHVRYGAPKDNRPDDAQVYVGQLKSQVTADGALSRVAESFDLSKESQS